MEQKILRMPYRPGSLQHIQAVLEEYVLGAKIYQKAGDFPFEWSIELNWGERLVAKAALEHEIPHGVFLLYQRWFWQTKLNRVIYYNRKHKPWWWI